MKRFAVVVSTMLLLLSAKASATNADARSQSGNAIPAQTNIRISATNGGNNSDTVQKQITGTVTDATGEPVIGASVTVPGTKIAAVTDIDGNFTLKVPADAKLHITYVGCKPVELNVAGKDHFEVTLEDDTNVLDEVVVVGYGTMKRKEMTSAISHVSAKDLNVMATTDAAMLLQGKVSSLTIDNSNVGDPNTSASMQIRGVSSRSAALGPLVVVDGVPGADINNINPADIESIDVLKDGAASAIYGTRGSNGVILVSLKKGARDNNMHVTYQGALTVLTPKKELEFLSADEWRRLKCKTDPTLDYGGNDNWYDAVTQTAVQQMHTISLAGGGSNANLRVTADYRDADGIVKTTNRTEYGARASMNLKTNSGLLFFSANVAPRLTKINDPGQGMITNALHINPTVPIYDKSSANGYYVLPSGSGFDNYVERLYEPKRQNDKKQVTYDGTAGIDFFSFIKQPDPSWVLKTQVMFAQNHWDKSTGSYEPSTMSSQVNAGRNGSASRGFNKGHEDNFEWVTNFAGTIAKDNHFRLMFGYSYNYGNTEGMSASNADFDNDGLGFNNIGQGTQAAEEGKVNMSSWKSDHKLIGFFGRVNYDWKERYLLSASVRREGSSRFGENYKWGTFPAVSIGWRISDESFMHDLTWLDDLKIRGDYGETGNQEIGNYNSLATYGSYGWYSYNGDVFHCWGPSRNPNPNLRWEKAKNMNFGIDFSVLDGKISGSLNYYHRKQQDLLGNYDTPVPPNLFNTIYTNVGTMINQGFEFDISFSPIRTKDFSWTFTVLGATNDNKFTNFSNDVYTGQSYYPMMSMSNPSNPGYLQRIEEGKRVGNFYTYRFAGFSESGDWLIYNKENEVIPVGKGTDDDKTYTGNGLPKFTGSMTHNFTWRQFDLGFTLRGAAGFQLFNTQEFYFGIQSLPGNVLRRAYTKNAQLTTGVNVLSDYFIENGDYLKIDNITVGYTQKLKSKFLPSFRVYASFNNIHTFTKFSGVDPSTFPTNGLTPGAWSWGVYYPSVFNFNCGVQLNF